MSDRPHQAQVSFRDRRWLRAALGVGSALFIQELASSWGSHLPATDLYPLAIAVGMSFYNLHIFRIKPATDHRSRLRALWYPQQKKIAIVICLLLLLVSLAYAFQRVQRPVRELSLIEINSLRAIKRGPMTVTGSPDPNEKPYRWVFSEPEEEDEAPYLTPLKNFKGQLIVVSHSPLTESLVETRGWLSELSIFVRPHYVAYRNYMGLSANAPIYLFDIRGVWWFDPQSIAGVIAALVFLIATIGSATRDPDNTSRLIYIPPGLRGDYEEPRESEEPSENEELSESEEFSESEEPSESSTKRSNPEALEQSTSQS